jgi:hypothetical protein
VFRRNEREKGISIGENEWGMEIGWMERGRKEIWECGKKELL